MEGERRDRHTADEIYGRQQGEHEVVLNAESVKRGAPMRTREHHPRHGRNTARILVHAQLPDLRHIGDHAQPIEDYVSIGDGVHSQLMQHLRLPLVGRLLAACWRRKPFTAALCCTVTRTHALSKAPTHESPTDPWNPTDQDG